MYVKCYIYYLELPSFRQYTYLEEFGVGWVEGGVDVTGVVLAGEVEEPRAEQVAVPDADRVPT